MTGPGMIALLRYPLVLSVSKDARPRRADAMALGPRLDLRQSQTLAMTPQLQQAIKLLALSNLEIEAFLGEALETNPLLDAGEITIEAPAASDTVETPREEA